MNGPTLVFALCTLSVLLLFCQGARDPGNFNIALKPVLQSTGVILKNILLSFFYFSIFILVEKCCVEKGVPFGCTGLCMRRRDNSVRIALDNNFPPDSKCHEHDVYVKILECRKM